MSDQEAPALTKKPRRTRAGRPNVVTKDLRAMVTTALHLEGGIKYLRWAARKEPRAFLGLVAKLMPQKIEADVTLTTLEAVVARAREMERAGITESLS